MTVSTPRSARPTPRSARPTACCATPLATRFTRATGDCDRRRGRLRALLLRLLDFREEDLRPPLLRPAEDFRPLRRRDDFLPPDLRALLARFLVDRLRAPPLLASGGSGPRPLSTTTSTTGLLGCSHWKAPCRRVCRTDSKIRAQQHQRTPYTASRMQRTPFDYLRTRVSPCRMIQRSLLSEPDARHS